LVDAETNLRFGLGMPESDSIRGRGAMSNPANRFEKVHLEPDLEADDGQPRSAPKTQLFKDRSCSILTRNDSPDVGYEVGLNPYRGCEHGCIYCYARPLHEYLGFSAGLDFESKILVKENAPELLRKELASPKWKPCTIGLSSATDCYQPLERRLRLTRKCLEILTECRNPAGIITKNFLVTRDLDLLQELARHQAVTVCLSITTLDSELARAMEPRTSSPAQRLSAIKILSEAGIPVGVLVAPVIPGLTDHEMLRIVGEAAAAGARFAGYEMLRLPHGVKDLFQEWLKEHFPEKMEKVLNRIRAVRGGELNDPNFGTRMVGTGIFAEQVAKTFKIALHKAGISKEWPTLSTASFRRPQGDQLTLL
jgi:DNA repair photolyase